MIGVTNQGKSFRALIAYVLKKKDGIEQDPVAWTASRNLPTDDPKRAVSFMNATALQTPRAQEPAYHIALSFAPEDPVDRAMMEGVADRLLARLGLAEHQAVLVAHRDRPHAHVHIVVNRIHPETGRTWDPWHDWKRIRHALSAEERALGLRPADSRMEKVNELASDVRKYERVVELSSELYGAQMDASAARARASQLELAAKRADTTRTRCERALASIYRNPDGAYRGFYAFAEAHTPGEAARAMRDRPEQFGALVAVERSRAFGLLHTLDESPARAAARSAAVAAGEAFEAARVWRSAVQSDAGSVQQTFERGRPGHDVALTFSQSELEGATARERAIRAELGTLPRRREFERHLSAALGRLLPHEVNALRVSITAPQRALLAKIRGVAREIAFGREEEPERARSP
jgi:hypothetical protein